MRMFLIAAVLVAGCSGAEAQSVDAAIAAYGRNRVAEAEAMLARLAADPATPPAEKARAQRELARIAWVIDGDADAALAALDRAGADPTGHCPAAMLRARVLQEAGRAGPLLADPERLAAACDDAADRDRILLDAAEAALDAAVEPAAAEANLVRAEALLAALGGDARSGLEGSAAALQLALLRGDADGALQAWRNYFWLAEADLPQALRRQGTSGAEIFGAGLAPDAAVEAQLHLVDLLVRAGFAREAERFARRAALAGRAAGRPLWAKASAYFEARREFEAAILASNRRVARGGDAADLSAAYERAAARLMAAAGLRGDRAQALRRGYGLYGTVGNTGGYASVHLGHVVQDERRTIEQYGHRADVSFLAVDNMLSNGFESWLWDGTAAAGGWTDPGPVIVQVRTGYTSQPLNAWSLFSDPAARARVEARQRERAAADLAALQRAEVAYLPGLADRLRLQVADQVGARARATAGEGGDLRRAFLDEYWRASYQQSIFLHEGRHALDRSLVRGLARLRDSNLEYRAKLSELALAEYPRLALFNINNGTVGDGSPHGEANEDVLEAYVEWMRANSGRIAGYDGSQPTLAQLDRLTDDQIRAVARALDPIAR